MNTTILHVTPYLSPTGIHANGTVTVLAGLAREASACKHAFLTCGDRPEVERLNENARVITVPVPQYRHHQRTADIVRQSVEFAQLAHDLLEGQGELLARRIVVVAHGCESAIFASELRRQSELRCSALRSARWALQTHYWLPEFRAACLSAALPSTCLPPLEDLHVRAELADGVLGAFDAVFVESAITHNFLRRSRSLNRASSISIAPVGFVDACFSPESGQEPVEGRPEVLVAGRCSFEKGFDIAIKAFLFALERRTIAHNTHLSCHLIMREPFPYEHQTAYKEYLAAMVEQSAHADSISILPRLTQEELAQKMRTAACVVVPSRFEPLGLVGLEARSVGAHVVASSACGFLEYGSDQASVVFRSGDAEHLAEVLPGAMAAGLEGARRSGGSSGESWRQQDGEVVRAFEARCEALHGRAVALDVSQNSPPRGLSVSIPA